MFILLTPAPQFYSFVYLGRWQRMRLWLLKFDANKRWITTRPRKFFQRVCLTLLYTCDLTSINKGFPSILTFIIAFPTWKHFKKKVFFKVETLLVNVAKVYLKSFLTLLKTLCHIKTFKKTSYRCNNSQNTNSLEIL